MGSHEVPGGRGGVQRVLQELDLGRLVRLGVLRARASPCVSGWATAGQLQNICLLSCMQSCKKCLDILTSCGVCMPPCLIEHAIAGRSGEGVLDVKART